MSVAPTTPVMDKDEKVAKAEVPGAPQAPGMLAALAARPKVVLLVVAVLVAIVSAVVSGSGVWPADLTFNLKPPFDDLNDWLVDNRDTHWVFLYFLLHIANTAESSVDSVVGVLDSLGVIGVTVAAVLIAWYAGGAGLHRRALRTAGTALAAFLAIGLLGVWDKAMDTLGLMVVCVIAAALVGVLLGLIAGLSERGERILRPVFDTMQVLPAFSYLLPFVLIFGTGIPSAFVATVIYAAPPMARLTALGLRGADAAALEASRSLGAT
ncbi:ABC transporter permease subunit, partial [Streptomyces sp. T-3]|nr:ABC transporter permease subunit [Streptomyces sp. T-3]